MNTKQYVPTLITKRRVERGGVAVIVGVLLGTGVLLGASALTLDVGSIMWERRQLQNSADAAALALASACAKNAANCTTTNSVIGTYVNANVRDGAASIDGVCGRFGSYFTPAGTWTACSSATDNATQRDTALKDLGACVPLPASLTSGDGLDVPYVEVRAGTGNGTTKTLLPSIFSKAITGTDNPHVTACARAAWGAPGGTGTTFPLTISVCDWYAATSAGYAPSPPYSPAPVTPPTSPASAVPSAVSSYVVKITAHENGNPATACGPSMVAPGGFGWLDDTDSSDDCAAKYDANGQAPGKPGGPPTNGCKNAAMQKYLGTEVLIPVFTSVVDGGNNTVYTLAGVSSFYFAGWDNMQTASPSKEYSVYKSSPANNICGNGVNAKTCIWGWFTSPILPLGTLAGGAPSRGPKTISLGG